MRRSFASSLVAACSFVALACLASGARADDIVVDLKGGASPPTMAPSGGMPPATVFWESEGLRIKLAADRKQLGPVGAKTRFNVSGDFEITAACDLIDAPAKSSVFGSGARLFVKFDSTKGEVASLSRVKREKGGDVYLGYFVYKDENGKQKELRMQYPAKSKSGWLRLRRTGEKLAFEASDEGKVFEPVLSVPVGKGDLQEVSLTATTGSFAAATEVRWKELQITAEDLGTQQTLATNSGPSRLWIWILCGTVVAFVVVAIPVGMKLRKRR